MTVAEVIATASAFSVIFLGVFRFLLSKVQADLKQISENLAKFQKDITDKINGLDKSLAVKASTLEYMNREIDELKLKMNQCKYCRGISDE